MQNSKQCPTCWERISPYFVAAQSSMSAWPASSACQPSQAASAQPAQSSQPSRKLRQPAQRHRPAQPKQPASLDTKAMQPALAPEGWYSPWSPWIAHRIRCQHSHGLAYSEQAGCGKLLQLVVTSDAPTVSRHLGTADLSWRAESCHGWWA